MTVDTTKEPCPFCQGTGPSESRITGQLAWQLLMNFRRLPEAALEAMRVEVQLAMSRNVKAYDAFMNAMLNRTMIGSAHPAASNATEHLVGKRHR